MSDHARLSPSGSKKWFACPGSLALEAFVPNVPNDYSDDGTACHHVLEQCLKQHIAGLPGTDADAYVGDEIPVNGSDEPERLFEFTDTMAEKTQIVIDGVIALAGEDILTAEERVDFSEDIAIPDQFGTLDVSILRVALKELCIADAKFGYRPVPVERNTQLMTYALAKYRQIELIYEVETVRFFIFQPTLRTEPFEWSCTIEELLAFASTLRSKGCSVQLAQREFDDWLLDTHEPLDGAPFDLPAALLDMHPRLKQWAETFLNPRPNAEECAFCRVMHCCPNASLELQRLADANFGVIAEDEAAGRAAVNAVQNYSAPRLSEAMKAAPFMEDWITAVRAETERKLLRGEEVEGFGLQLGRQGIRRWRDAAEAEAEFKRQRLNIEQMYNLKLISPTQAEKLAKVKKPKKGEQAVKPIIGPRLWKQMQDMIVRADPKPSVKPAHVITTPYSPTQPDESGFEAIPEPQPEVEEDLS